MSGVDRRLVRRAPGLRRYLGRVAVTSVAGAVLVVVQATLLADLLATAVLERPTAAELSGRLAAVCAVVALRAGTQWITGALASGAAAEIKAGLRTDLMAHAAALGPGWLSRQRAGELTTVATRGLDALDPYLIGYLPQVYSAVAVPVAVIARLTFADLISALVVAVTLPLIPVFAALVGIHTREQTARQWRRLSQLGGHFLDVVTGMATLRVFGRAEAQVEIVRRMADSHRIATMRTLRVAFLSALVLELVATLSVALVAVPVGLRLLVGEPGMQLHTALLVLLLAPEAYLPLRAAGAKFHAGAEGLAVLDRILGILDEKPPSVGSRAGVDLGRSEIRYEGVTVRYPGRSRPALDDVTLSIRPGERIALIGPSGAGKSTLLALLLGFVRPTTGRILVGGVDIGDLDPDLWREQVVWLPQRPHVFAGDVERNLRLGAPDASEAEVRAAVDAAALDVDLGRQAGTLSAGEGQRMAVARAFLRRSRQSGPLLLLDEPTAHLDGMTEGQLLTAVRRLADGATCVVVAHRPAVLELVDRVIEVDDGKINDRTVRYVHS